MSNTRLVLITAGLLVNSFAWCQENKAPDDPVAKPESVLATALKLLPAVPAEATNEPILKELAAKKKCGFADLHRLFIEALKKKPAGIKDKGWLTRDGVHMLELGNNMMAVGVLRALGVSDAKIADAAAIPDPVPARKSSGKS